MSDGDSSPGDQTARNAEIARRFQALDPPGAPGYWAALADTARASRLDLEALVMCVRERLAAGAREQADHVLGLLWDRIQGDIRRQIVTATPTSARNRDQLIEDIMQECAIALWMEITREDDTFLTRGFWHKLRYMVANTTTQRLIAEGVKARRDVQRAKRVQQSQTASLDQAAGPEDDTPLSERVADPRAGEPFDLAERLADLNAVIHDLTSAQRSLLWNTLSEELTQAQIAAQLGITDRALRMRLTALRRELRKRLYGWDDPHGPDAPSGGEEG